jgi:hypothetical protein
MLGSSCLTLGTKDMPGKLLSLINPVVADPFYPPLLLLLCPAVCRAWSGELHGAEGQQLSWVTAHQLRDYAMPAADIPLVNPVLAALAADTP